MENISKALLIAGGILLGLLLISLLLNVFNLIYEKEQLNEEILSVEQLEKFNAYYESFDYEDPKTTKLYGTDVITILNKANDDNKKLQDDEKISILVTFYDDSGNEIDKATEEFTDMDYLEKIDVPNYRIKKKLGGYQLTTRKQYKFVCIDISYYDTGRVRGMHFEQLIYDEKTKDWVKKKKGI